MTVKPIRTEADYDDALAEGRIVRAQSAIANRRTIRPDDRAGPTLAEAVSLSGISHRGPLGAPVDHRLAGFGHGPV